METGQETSIFEKLPGYHAKDHMTSWHVDVLSRELQRRKDKNPRYSLRAFAHYLEMEPAALSRILAGKQPLSLRSTRRVVEILKLGALEREAFFASVTETLKTRASVFLHHSTEDGSPVSLTEVRPTVPGLMTARLHLDPEKLDAAAALFQTFAKSLESLYGSGTRPEVFTLELRPSPQVTDHPAKD